MFSAALLSIAVVAMGQFAVYYWRAVFTGMASLPISSRVLEAAQVQEASLCGNDFEKFASLLTFTPELKETKSGLGMVRAYYTAVQSAETLFAKFSPMMASWAEKERVLCARIAAVYVDQRLEANLIQAASIRSL
ncbi:MAG TPA: hypothetical protein VK728_04705 [Candidatus Sulfotelmatobacter sp.]|jgi:hypothetical protein|nr:hypothetical protein [Candidatus Sulfotelmatobacter sp.]